MDGIKSLDNWLFIVVTSFHSIISILSIGLVLMRYRHHPLNKRDKYVIALGLIANISFGFFSIIFNMQTIIRSVKFYVIYLIRSISIILIHLIYLFRFPHFYMINTFIHLMLI